MADAEGGTRLDHARGVVVDNYGTVFNTFLNAAPELKSYVRTEQFRALVNDRTRSFVGRDFVFDQIDRLLDGDGGDSGYILVRGEPGIGKTAIASTLVLRHGYVHHFNIAPDNIRTAQQFLENVCSQLILRYRLPYETLPPQASEDGGFFAQLLSEAAELAASSDTLPVVVVIDALDEAERPAAGTSANRLFLPPTLPSGVFVVVTTRGEADPHLHVDREHEIWIDEHDPANLADVTEYVEGFLAEHPAMSELLGALSPEQFVALLTERSEGNFMYLVHVLPDISAGHLPVTSGDAALESSPLPRGLTGYYRRHWRDMKAADEEYFDQRQRPVLCFLAITGEPVSVAQLCEWTGLEPARVSAVIKDWREFLNEHPGPPRLFRLYHRSFAEFLDEEENLRWYHDRIVDVGLAKIPGFLTS